MDTSAHLRRFLDGFSSGGTSRCARQFSGAQRLAKHHRFSRFTPTARPGGPRRPAWHLDRIGIRLRLQRGRDRQALLDGHWHHVAATYDGTHIRIYHNGKQLAEERTVEEGAGEYTVHRPDHWILAGTGLRQGDKFGAEDGICGYECDGCEIVWQDGLPIATGRDGTPRDFVVVATGPARWDAPEGTLKWAHDIRKSWPVKPGDLVPDDLEQDGYASVGTYTRNGTVVTVGSCDWSDGLKAGNPTVDRIVRNILNRLLE